jgi:hypothetical protein
MNWQRLGDYRVIPEWSAYQIGPEADVWSMPRQVRCKGGGTRLIPWKQIKPSDGRVSLSQDGRRGRFNVHKQLFPLAFPELCGRPQVFCHNGHPISVPINPDIFGSLAPVTKVARWGTGNRICLWCSEPPEAFDSDNTYSLHYGVAIPADYSDLPAQPKIGSSSRLFKELEWGYEHGYRITASP